MSDTTSHSLKDPAPAREHPAWMHGLHAALWLYLFVSAINVMGGALKTLGKSTTWLEDALAVGGHPIIALMGGVFVTAVVQSSSFTTALIILLVGAGEMNVETAVYAVMGANIGTSITNNLVSIGTMRITRQFRRGYTAALMHGNVNLLTVGVLLPLEWISGAMSSTGHGLLTRFSIATANWMGLSPVVKPNSPIKWLTTPVVDLFNWVGDLVTPSEEMKGILVAVLGLVLLFLSLLFMVTNLKGALLRRVESLFSSFLFRNDFMSGVVGVVSTIFVQSSSVTTSLMVPLASAGAVTIRRAFPFMLGCNLGTTVTGVIAATANPAADAVSVAVCHVTFNVLAALVWYPLRAVPIGLAAWYAQLAARSRRYYFVFLGVVYFLVPLVVYLLTTIFLGSS
jgi:sodium-dependent phosphate cotransporter